MLRQQAVKHGAKNSSPGTMLLSDSIRQEHVSSLFDVPEEYS
jgi:hypothetical protein